MADEENVVDDVVAKEPTVPPTPIGERINTFRPYPVDQIEAGTDVYVGSEEFLDSLVRLMITTSLERRAAKPDTAFEEDKLDCKRAAKILLGRDKRYKTTPWYGPGGIDLHLAKWVGVDCSKPGCRVYGAMIVMLAEVHEIVNKAAEMLDEQWEADIEGTIDKYVGLMLGLTLPQIMRDRVDQTTDNV